MTPQQQLDAALLFSQDRNPGAAHPRPVGGALCQPARHRAKTQIKIGPGGGFCWIWPPRRRIKGGPDHCFYLSFGLRRPLEHPRVAASAHPTRTRWTIHTLVENAGDLDSLLLSWLDEAHRPAALQNSKKDGSLLTGSACPFAGGLLFHQGIPLLHHCFPFTGGGSSPPTPKKRVNAS